MDNSKESLVTLPLNLDLALSSNNAFIDTDFKFANKATGALKAGALYPLAENKLADIPEGHTFIDYIDGHMFTLNGNVVYKDGVAIKTLSNAYKVEKVTTQDKIVSIGCTGNDIYIFNPTGVTRFNAVTKESKTWTWNITKTICNVKMDGRNFCFLYTDGSFQAFIWDTSDNYTQKQNITPTYRVWENNTSRKVAFSGNGTLVFEYGGCFSDLGDTSLGYGYIVSITTHVGNCKANEVGIYTGCFPDGGNFGYSTDSVEPNDMRFWDNDAWSGVGEYNVYETLHYCGTGQWDCVGIYYEPGWNKYTVNNDRTYNIIQKCYCEWEWEASSNSKWTKGADQDRWNGKFIVYRNNESGSTLHRPYEATYCCWKSGSATMADIFHTITGWSVGSGENACCFIGKDEEESYLIGVYGAVTPPSSTAALDSLDIEDTAPLYFPGISESPFSGKARALYTYDGNLLTLAYYLNKRPVTAIVDYNTVGSFAISNVNTMAYSVGNDVYFVDLRNTNEVGSWYTIGNRYISFSAAGDNTYDVIKDRWVYNGDCEFVDIGYTEKNKPRALVGYRALSWAERQYAVFGAVNWDSTTTFGSGYNLNFQVSDNYITGLNTGGMILYSCPKVNVTLENRDYWNDFAYYIDYNGSSSIPYAGNCSMFKDMLFPTNSGILWNTTPDSKLNISYNNMDSVTTEKSTYLLSYFAQQVVNVYKTATSVPGTKAFFVLQSQQYAVIGDHIVAINYDSSGSLSNMEEICNIQGMTFIGNIPSVAYFYSTNDKAMYAFTGDANLQLYAQSNMFTPTGFLYNAGNMDIWVKGLYNNEQCNLVIGNSNSFLNFNNVIKIEDGAPIVLNDALYELRWDIGQGEFEIETSFFGDSNVSVANALFIRVLKDRDAGDVSVKKITLTNTGSESAEETRHIDGGFDVYSNSKMLRFNLGNIQGYGHKFIIKSNFPIVDVKVEFVNNIGVYTETANTDFVF